MMIGLIRVVGDRQVYVGYVYYFTRFKYLAVIEHHIMKSTNLYMYIF